MAFIRTLRLGLLHAAVAITLVPITGVLNRIMIHELGIAASLVALLIVLPHLLAPVQVFVGRFSDTHPLWGYRRTPYIALGLLLCIGGAVLTPQAALLMATNFWPGLFFALAVFLCWGLGFNLAVVSYLSLASDLSGEEQRARTIAIMWFLMITAVIITAITTGRALDPYSEPRLIEVFAICGVVALLVALVALVGLEPRQSPNRPIAHPGERISTRQALAAVFANPHARVFFVYLMLLLSAILGQDVLLEPFGAAAFAMDVKQTTQLTATWGGATLLALLLYGLLLNGRMSKRSGAFLGGSLAAGGLIGIALSGILLIEPLFVPGVALLGFGTGIATATNLALMLDMTTPDQVGFYIGAWGVADAMARGLGNLLGGVARDLVSMVSGNAIGGYVSVFLIEALLLGFALLLLRRIDVAAFRGERTRMAQVIAAAGDA
jgi:MFS transporter, BCD family, chlorophyll transporter